MKTTMKCNPWRCAAALLPLALLAGLAGCASTYGPGDLQPGLSETEVTQRLGAPTGRYALPEGRTRLEFARGPFGRHTFMVDVDASGRLLSWGQVLEPRFFSLIVPGQSRDEVLRTIGRPGEVVGMMRNGQIWSWRYPNNDCLWYQVSLDAAGTVTSAGYGVERGCDAPNDRS